MSALPAERQALQAPPAVDSVLHRLAAPFDARHVKFRPGAVSGNRALALPYIDSRAVQDRLDEVMGPLNWSDEYEHLPNGAFLCRLRLRLGGEWVLKMDVGGQSEQPDEGDRCKAAVSDALKRAAVKFGIGRYLYGLPAIWADFDPKRKQFVRPPDLPGVARPAQQPAQKAPAATKGMAAPDLPQSGKELQQRLYDYDARLSRAGLCAPGDVLRHVCEAGRRLDYQADVTAWSGAAIRWAVEEARAFGERAKNRKPKAAHPQPAQPQPAGAPAPQAPKGPGPVNADLARRRGAEITPLLAKLGLGWGDVLSHLFIAPKDDPGLSGLTEEQYQEALTTLKRQAREPAPAR